MVVVGLGSDGKGWGWLFRETLIRRIYSIEILFSKTTFYLESNYLIRIHLYELEARLMFIRLQFHVFNIREIELFNLDFLYTIQNPVLF